MWRDFSSFCLLYFGCLWVQTGRQTREWQLVIAWMERIVCGREREKKSCEKKKKSFFFLRPFFPSSPAAVHTHNKFSSHGGISHPPTAQQILRLDLVPSRPFRYEQEISQELAEKCEKNCVFNSACGSTSVHTAAAAAAQQPA